MLHLYCRNQHGTHRDLCKSCRNLLAYVGERLAQCPFSENKWPCSNCRVHCYREPQRSQIRDVMRYSGPRMLWIHPVMAIRHLVKLLHYRR
ncbi:nitrous oxide-stimulated promoter family protein [bacterium]|nr:nitrous oxide-stimulated promoter family protein [bacterium]